MDHRKNKSSGSREASKKAPPPSLVIVLAIVGGMAIGSAGTFFFFKPPAAPPQTTAPAGVGTAPAQTISMPQPQFTPAPQPPGEVPPGKVWSVEHGHWHDAPALAPTTVTPGATLTPAPATVTPVVATPPAAAVPLEKKE